MLGTLQQIERSEARANRIEDAFHEALVDLIKSGHIDDVLADIADTAVANTAAREWPEDWKHMAAKAVYKAMRIALGEEVTL